MLIRWCPWAFNTCDNKNSSTMFQSIYGHMLHAKEATTQENLCNIPAMRCNEQHIYSKAHYHSLTVMLFYLLLT